jgi:hypothetical protein
MTDSHSTDALDEVVDQFRKMPAPDRPADTEVLARFAAQNITFHPARISNPFLKRILLHPAFRYGTAATVVFAATSWLILNSASPLVLGDVIKAAEQHKVVRFTIIHGEQPIDSKAIRRDKRISTAYIDLRSPRFRWELSGKSVDNVIEFRQVIILDDKAKRYVSLVVDEKHAKDETQAAAIRESRKEVYKHATIGSVSAKDMGQPFNSVTREKSLLDNLRDLEAHKETVAAKAKLDGRDVVIYRLKDEKKTSTFWVDAESKLPIRAKYEYVDGDKWTYTDFEWDPNVKDPERLFNTTVPDGFTIFDYTIRK